jgi:hypothetical protein
MKEVGVPISDGEYAVVFPEKGIYCGAYAEVKLRET